jgi:hypothetical protein
MKYIVIKDCVGFRNRYWAKGTVVELAKGELPPHHFEVMSGPVEQVAVPNELIALSQIAAPKMPTTGMAAGLEDNNMTLRESVTVPEVRRRGRKPGK